MLDEFRLYYRLDHSLNSKNVINNTTTHRIKIYVNFFAKIAKKKYRKTLDKNLEKSQTSSPVTNCLNSFSFPTSSI